MNICNTPPNPQMTNFRFLLMPYFIWRLSLDSRCRTTIKHVNTRSQTLSPKFLGQTRLFQQSHNPFSKDSICTLSNSILLWSVPTGMLPCNSTFIHKVLEFL